MHSMDVYAESYVFGGRAHFNGVLVNAGCAIGLDNLPKEQQKLKRNFNEVVLRFSECSPWVFAQLSLNFSDIEQTPQKAFLQTKKEGGIAEILKNKQQDMNLDKSGRDRIYYHYNSPVTGDTEKMMGVIQVKNHTKKFSGKALFSVVYP